jgi:hypothetical protein
MESSVVSPRDQKSSYEMLLVGLRQQTQIFTANLQQAVQANKQIIKAGSFDGVAFKAQPDKTLEQLMKLNKVVQNMAVTELVDFFEHYDACNTICGCFTSVLQGMLEAVPITETTKLLKQLQTKGDKKPQATGVLK